MITFMESKEDTKETEKTLDSQFWHACAGSMVQMPLVNSMVFYFPQGHSEHASENVEFRNCPTIPSHIPCKVSKLNFMADHETDEVFAKIRLIPVIGNEIYFDSGEAIGISNSENLNKPPSFAKTLTQSDANNGGGFSVPRYCAETIFPRLDYSADPPVQTILVKDVHGKIWEFRHIYRGTPRRHLLTSGWSTFVNIKRLVAGDSIVFSRAENGDLCVGIRRVKRGICGDGNLMGRVRAESVIEAANLAGDGKPFDVVFYPRASMPEFCVKASLVKSALKIQWCSGMRFKMAFETEDSSRISWFMGTITSVQVVDPTRWPDSPWRLLQVTWDEPDLLQNVKRVNPWLVELVSNMPSIHFPTFSPPFKKMKLPGFPFEDHQIPLPIFSGDNHLLGPSNNPIGCLKDNIPAGMQGARHTEYGTFPNTFLSLDRASVPTRVSNNNDNVLLNIGNSNQESKESDKKAPFVLFGQHILTEKQISLSCSSEINCSSDGNADKMGNTSDGSGSGHIQNDAPEEAFESELK